MLLAFLWLFVFPISAQESVVDMQNKINQLALNMDFVQVRHVMGEPLTKLKRGLSTRWNYRVGEHQLTLWFGSSGLRNATGAVFQTAHLVAPPAGYIPPPQYDKAKDAARYVEIKPHSATKITVDESIFDPILE